MTPTGQRHLSQPLQHVLWCLVSSSRACRSCFWHMFASTCTPHLTVFSGNGTHVSPGTSSKGSLSCGRTPCPSREDGLVGQRYTSHHMDAHSFVFLDICTPYCACTVCPSGIRGEGSGAEWTLVIRVSDNGTMDMGVAVMPNVPISPHPWHIPCDCQPQSWQSLHSWSVRPPGACVDLEICQLRLMMRMQWLM